tara:strand:- start:29894 stop:30706 length:813 start_codon:yes stop_codon:yes gene_type:complete
MKNITIFCSIALSVLSISSFAQNPKHLTGASDKFNNDLLSYTNSTETANEVKSTKESSSSLCNKGVQKFRQKDYLGAVEAYNKALKLEPQNVNALFNRANAHFALNNHKLALIDYSSVIELEPTDKVAYFQRGMTKMALGQYKKAIKDFTAASRLDRFFMDAYLQRGVAKLKSTDFEEANRDFKIVIKYDPSSFVYLQKGLAEMGLGNYSQAKKDLTKSIELDPQNAEAYFKRGVAYYDGGSRKNAVKDWEKAKSMGHELASKALAKYGN